MTTPANTVLRSVTMADAEALARIYNHYIRTTVVTFEEEEINAVEMGRRIEVVAAASLPWLVIEQDDRVVGYAYASKWRGRRSYRFSVETSVYLDQLRLRRGLGLALYGRLLAILEECGMHVAIGGITLPNDASVALHEKFGFRKVAHFEEVGFKLGRWLDVGYWQRTLGHSKDSSFTTPT